MTDHDTQAKREVFCAAWIAAGNFDPSKPKQAAIQALHFADTMLSVLNGEHLEKESRE